MLCSFLWFGGKIFGGYVFTGLVRQPAAGPFGDNIFSFYVFTELVLFVTSGASGGHFFLFYGFTNLILLNTSGASGGHISVLTEIWKRATKGAAAPVGSPGLMLTGFDVSVPDGFALVPRPNFNQGRRWRLSPPLRAYCGAVENRRQYRDLGSAPQGHFFRRCWASPSGRSTHESGGSSACNRFSDCKKEANADGTPPDGPKSR